MKTFEKLNIAQQLSKYSFWDMKDGFFPGCYCSTGGELRFRGLIAAHKILSEESVALTIGTESGYLDLVCPRRGFNSKSRIVQGVQLQDDSVERMKYFS